MAGDNAAEFYWCLHHKQVETTQRCGAAMRLGPYGSPEEAQRYAEKAAQRDDAWEKEDERWQGPS